MKSQNVCVCVDGWCNSAVGGSSSLAQRFVYHLSIHKAEERSYSVIQTE